MSEEDKNNKLGTANDSSSVPPLLGDLEEGYPAGEHQALAAYAAEASPTDNDTMYKYRDFGHVAEDDDDVASAEIPPPTLNNRGGSESSIRVQKFPVKLYAILAQKEFHDIICWMPHGRSWKVLKPSMFESLVMPLFFEYSNYHSFNRLVNAWSFRRISSGPDRGSYYHELFLRGKPHLQKYMRRLPKTHKKLPMKKKDEPDFYALDKTNPLPAVEDAPIPGAAATVQAMRANQQQGTPTHMNMSPVDHSPGENNSTVVTPSLSPNHAQQIIAGSHHQHNMMSSGNMNVPSMGMGPGIVNGMQNGIQGGQMMNQQQQMMLSNQGMGPPGIMNAMQGGNGMGIQGGRGPPLNPRFNSYSELPSGVSHDEYDSAPPQPMMGRNGYPMNNGYPGGFQGVGNGGRPYNNNSDLQQSNGMRRPVPMRQGLLQMDQMHGSGERMGLHQQQPDFYPGYGQHPLMLPSMQQQALYNRGATASPGGNSHDDYSTQAGSQSSGGGGGGGGGGGMSRLHQAAARGTTRG